MSKKNRDFHISIRLTENEKTTLNDFCKLNGISVSEFVRELIEREINEIEQK